MAAITNFSWKGRGRVWVGDTSTGGLREMGNCTAVSLAFDTTEDELPDYRTTADGNYASDVQIVINGALGKDVAPCDPDVDGDGFVNAMDIQLVILGALDLI